MSTSQTLLALLEAEPAHGYTLKQRYDERFAREAASIRPGLCRADVGQGWRRGPGGPAEKVSASVDAEVFVPRSTPGVDRLMGHTQAIVLAVAYPGADLSVAVHGNLGPPASRHFSYAPPDPSYYNFVAGLRELVWAVAGLMLAIGLGALAGAAYLAFANEAHAVPWQPALVLAGVSATAAVVVAAFTVIGASPPIRPELIRTE